MPSPSPHNSSLTDLQHTVTEIRHSYKYPAFTGYILFPILACLFWLATLIGLLCLWTVQDDARQYRSDEATVVFISDVGAEHKALFIPGTATTATFYTLSLLAERWLRHIDRIPGTISSRTRNWDILAVIAGILGGIALLLLSIFDAFNHSPVHWSFALIFIICIAISAAAQTVEIFGLKRDHPDRPHLRRNTIIKSAIVVVAIIIAIVFGVTYGICGGDLDSSLIDTGCPVVTSACAVCEWTIAFLYGLYLATFILDLWPAGKTSHRQLRRADKLLQEQRLKEKGSVTESHGTTQEPAMSEV